jgi:dipeptidyl aminopeptidase/acylaminoacyl peptidase
MLGFHGVHIRRSCPRLSGVWQHRQMSELTPEALWTVPRVGAPVALADGRLLVPVTTHDPETDAADTIVWMVNPAGGERRRFASGSISSLCISVDRSQAAYLRKQDDHRQAFVQPLDGGEATMIGSLPLGAAGVRWMPDGRLLALATLWRDHPDLEATRRHEPEPRLEVRATEDAIYRYWDVWLEHVYHPVILDPADGSALDLTPDSTRFWAWPSTNDTIGEIDVSPDGNLIAFSADDSEPPHRQLCWSVFVMGADGTGLRRLDTDRSGHSRRPRFTPDGSALAYGYQPEPDFYACRTQLIRHRLDEGTEEELAPGWDRSPDRWDKMEEDSWLLTAEDRGRSRLWRLDAGAAEPAPLTAAGWVSDPTVGPDGEIYALYHSLTSPPEVHRIEEDVTTAVTDFAHADLGVLGAAREITFVGGNDDPIQMWLVDPPGAEPEATLPLVHMIHGGPHGVFGDAWHWRWNPQVPAGVGYRVALVNFHGSTGWGEDFTASIQGAWGDLPFQDVEAATDHLVAAGLADPDRMAVTGGSYGGYLTAWITSQTDRYACAVAHAAVTSLPGMYASDVTSGRARAYGSEIWDDREAVERWSPASHAAGYETPTLVIHGERDARVPITQGLELYGVLVAKGVPARLIYFPGENHWILSRSNSIRWYQEVLAWLGRWL